jgi:hypothetical protein
MVLSVNSDEYSFTFCKKDGFNQEVDNDALKRTLKFSKKIELKLSRDVLLPGAR